MTFPLQDPKEIFIKKGAIDLGEIIVCPKIALEYDSKNPYKETSLYLIHAFLHLLGYKDKGVKERTTMEKEQQRLLQAAQNNACLLTF